MLPAGSTGDVGTGGRCPGGLLGCAAAAL